MSNSGIKIHIGETIKKVVDHKNVPANVICRHFDISNSELNEIYDTPNMDVNELLAWSIFLKYNFFAIYQSYYQTHHSRINPSTSERHVFVKNYYSPEMINYLIKLSINHMSCKEIQNKYNIPKTTLNRWVRKAII
jgi:hypothetical protein